MNDYFYYLCTACANVALISRIALYICPACACDLTPQRDLNAIADDLEGLHEMVVWTGGTNANTEFQ